MMQALNQDLQWNIPFKDLKYLYLKNSHSKPAYYENNYENNIALNQVDHYNMHIIILSDVYFI